MRRILAISTVAVTALGLSACGGGPADLTQEKAKSALIEAGDLPDGGWTAGSVDETKPSKDSGSSDDFLKDAKDVSQECKDAMKGMEALTPSEAKAYAKREYTKGSGSDGQSVQVVIATYDKAKEAPAKIGKIADACKTIKMSSGGMDLELKAESPELKAKGSDALALSADVLGQKMTVFMAAAASGNNLVAINSQGTDKEKVKQLVDAALTKQVEKVDKAAG